MVDRSHWANDCKIDTGEFPTMTSVQAQPERIVLPQPSTRRASIESRAQTALDAGVEALFSKLHDDGHWCSELEGDSILNSEYLLMKVILGQHCPEAPEGASQREVEKIEKMLVYLRRLQRSDGTWGQYPGSGADQSATVKAYFALKLFGDDPCEPYMVRARDAIIAAGGAERINTFSMFYLACLGQVSWDACPSIPPEVVFLPRWFPFHMNKVAAWTRTMILPLAICTSLKPIRQIDPKFNIDELFVEQRMRSRLSKPWDEGKPISWSNTFLVVDRALKVIQRLNLSPIRRKALAKAEAWLLDRMRSETTDGLGAIFPPMVYIQVALQAMGYRRDHPARQTAERELDRFIIEEPDHIRIQPCFSPVWDTGIALYALTEAGLTADNDERIARACDWLCDNEVTRTGDWIHNLRKQDRGLRLGDNAAAWAFEYRNEWYPDVDDTAMVAKALRRAVGEHGAGSRAYDASARAVPWILAMQNEDGGWAAFDRTTHRQWMEAIPFADHNAMQDPSCPDITGRTIEALVTCGVARNHPAIRNAVDYLWSTQHEAGWWPGRWGVNAVYGVWQATGGLLYAGETADPRSIKTLRWLHTMQNRDGGFGETADAYVDETLVGIGPSTASQTAWGAAALMHLQGGDSRSAQRAIEWLCDHQLDVDMAPAPPTEVDLSSHPEQSEIAWAANGKPAPIMSHPVAEPAGSWREGWYTGTGFPKVFYLRYHLYRHYFPVMTLARFLNVRRQAGVRH